jgi:hypothetical protein
VTTINVTARHIAKGKRRDCERCPVALAIRDAFPDLIYARVGPVNIALQRNAGEYLTYFAFPPEVLDFTRHFDFARRKPEPFTFELDYPAVTP